MEFNHKPIMIEEILSALNIKADGVYLDCTLGGAGHSSEIAKKLNENGTLIAVDKDQDAIDVATKRLESFRNVKIVKSDYNNIEEVLQNLNISKVDGILIDLGVSSYQLDNAERGFSFRFDGPLDMRMDKSQDFSAYNVVNEYSKKELVEVLQNYGEEEFANAISNNIIANRPISTTKQLADIIENSIPKKVILKRGGAHKKAFQAIRIEVNGELENLKNTLDFLISKLNKDGIFCVLTFHSLEDRIVKTVFKEHSTGCICPPKTPICICNHKADLKLVNKKPIVASAEEMQQNSRSTCAKLRAAQKI